MTRQFTLIRMLIVNVISLIFVISCGSGGGGDDVASTPVSVMNGAWSGQIHSDATGLDYDVVGLIYGGEVQLISTPANSIIVGSVSVSNDSFSMAATTYEIGGGVIDSPTVTGTYVAATSISATYASDSGVTGSISLVYDPIYDRSSSLSLTKGIWVHTDELATTTTINIYDDGTFVGGNSLGCAYSGDIIIIDETKNIYDTTLTVSNCGTYDGYYGGLAVLSDTVVTNDSLSFVLNRGDYILFTELSRL